VLFAIPRTAGWMAQWAELVLDEEQRIARPKQLYIGHEQRSYPPLDTRRDVGAQETEITGPL
jgi:citrate synthase